MVSTDHEAQELPTELVTFMETFRLPPGESLPSFLQRYDALMNAVPVPIPEMHETVVREADGWRVRAGIWVPESCGPAPVVLYFHGGGWTVGNHLTHRGFAAELVAAGFLVVSLDYRRAPKHPFPAAFEDCREALAWCAGHVAGYGGDPTQIAVGGDSAGANLAAAVLADDDGRTARAGLLLFGIYEYHDALDVLGGATGQVYVPAERLELLRGDPRLSPLYVADRLPVTYIGLGGRDPLAPESRRLQKKLEAAGVPHTYHELTDAPHSYIQLPGHPRYREGINGVVEFLRRHLAEPGRAPMSLAR